MIHYSNNWFLLYVVNIFTNGSNKKKHKQKEKRKEKS